MNVTNGTQHTAIHAAELRFFRSDITKITAINKYIT